MQKMQSASEIVSPADSGQFVPPFVRAPIVQPPTGGETLHIDRLRVRILVDSQVTGGAWTLVEYYAPPHFYGPSIHRHFATQETFYILSGTLIFSIEDKTGSALPGSCIVIPPGVRHGFINPEPIPVTFLIWFTPGGIEGYFRELVALRSQANVWPLADSSPLAELETRYDIHTVGQAASSA